MKADGRTTAIRPKPANALTETERGAIVELCNSEAFAHLPPSQIVPRLADRGRYIGSESSFYRVLHASSTVGAVASGLVSIPRPQHI